MVTAKQIREGGLVSGFGSRPFKKKMKQKEILKQLVSGLESATTYNSCMQPNKSYSLTFIVNKEIAKEIFKLASAKLDKKK